MKNRAKCKLCGDTIESYHSEDHVICKCGEIECWAGMALRCAAKDFTNFVRVDDEGNEIVVQYKENAEKDNVNPLYIIENLIESYKRLPFEAMSQPVSNSDMLSVLETLLAAFKAL
jgi:hypothetical protein